MAQTKRKTVKKTNKRAQKARVLRLVDFMPENERLAALKKAAERLDEAERTQELLKTVQRLTKAYKELGQQLNERVVDLESTATVRLDEIRERVAELTAVQSALELSERLSGRATEEIDEILDRVGLIRRAVHDAEIAQLKKRHKAARKAAETKARKAAERELKKQKRVAS